MGSLVLHHLPTSWHVDRAILSEEERVVIIRFGKDDDLDCMRQDDVLSRIAPRVEEWAVIYLCDNTKVKDFNASTCPASSVPPTLRPANIPVYELYDTCTIMFFWRNKHIMVDLGTGDNNKINWVIEDKQELIDIIETVYRGASKGRGLVVSPKDYSTRHRY